MLFGVPTISSVPKLPPTLPTAPGDEPQPGGDADGRRRREAAIRSAVLGALGRPGQLYRVAVVPLWDDHYRVNVLTGPDPTSVRTPHSYFVVADESGAILRSTPAIRKQY